MIKFLRKRALVCSLLLLFSMIISPPSLIYATNIKINDLVIDVTKEAVLPVDKEQKKDKTEEKKKKWLVQFSGPIREDEKQQLITLQCLIHDYVPDFAFIVTMDGKTRKEVEELPFIHGIAKYRPEHKIRKSLKKKISKDQKLNRKDIHKIHIRVDRTEHLPLLLSTVHQQKGEIIEVGRDVATVKISGGAIGKIAEMEEIIWIEEAVDLRLFNDTSGWTIQTYLPDYTKIWDMGLRGEGQIIGIGDTGLDYDMPWFHDPQNIPIGPEHRKVVGYMANTDDYDGNFGHGTHVACTAAGDRTPVDGSTTANGMAPKARLFIQDITPGEENAVYPPADLGLMFITPYTAGAHLHSNSWGAALNVYDTYARSADRFIWEHKDFLAFFANGNSGGWDGSIGTPATAKNVVSVGATENGTSAENLAGFSSNGPTADGRIKPTISAPGVAIVSADSDGIKDSYNSGTIALSGTSMATPTAAGAASLVRQYYLDGFWPSGTSNPAAGFEPSAALIKATLINCAQNMTGDFTDGSLPAYGQGWGRINLASTLHFSMDDNFLDIADIPTGLSTGSTWHQRYFSPGGQSLKVTLVWTDYPGMEGAARDLVNDLNLLVTTPEGITYTGNVFDNGMSTTGGSADELNVVEQVFIPTLQSGDYLVTVAGYNVPFGPQPFAVVVSGAVSISSGGFVNLDKSRYNDDDTVRVQVVDRDLNASSSQIEHINIYVDSTSEPGGEVVELIENDTNSSIFIGSVNTRPLPVIPGNGYLEVAEGDSITARYFDADDGTGNPASASASALADLTPPLISDIRVDGVGQDFARISWITDEPISAAVTYGENPDNPGAVQTDPWLLSSPLVQINGLNENTPYYFRVAAIDEAGNISQDDNNGLLYTFTTLNLPPELTLYSSSFTETYGTETVLYGTATDPSGIESVRITGTGLDQYVPWRPSDGYYELQAPLNIGENQFTVEATDALGNSGTSQITVTRFEQPDLTITSVVAPELGGFAQPVHIENTICNTGPGISPGTGFITWYLSDDSEISSSEDIKLKMEYYYDDDILPGECISLPVDIRLALPIGLVWNEYYLGVYVDSRSTVWESDEANNTGVADNRIVIEGADLAVTALSGPTEVAPGENFTVFSTVQNLGSGTSLPFELILYLSIDNEITTADIEIGSRYVFPLEPIDTPYWWYPSLSSDDTEIVLSSWIPEGIYYLGVIAAPGTTFYEPDKENNVFLGNTIRIGDVPDAEPPETDPPDVAPPDVEPPDVDLPDTVPPTVPQNLVAIAIDGNTVFLNWDAASDIDGSGVAGYLVYRNGSEIGTSTVTSYIDENLDAGTAYIYHIVAFDHAGNLSGMSVPVAITLQTVPMCSLPQSIYFLLLRPEK